MKRSFLCLIVTLTLHCGKTMASKTINASTNTLESSVVIAQSTTVHTQSYVENVENVTSDNSSVVTPKNDFVENVSVHVQVNVTVSEFENSTVNETEDDGHDIHSSFNLAIIPAVAVFVFIVVSCIKCCKWFRRYTRGGNKDENYYAVIVTEDDKDYGHVDILSESASTACDTVSSFTSFLKRSGNESTLTSLRALNQSMTSQPNNDVIERRTPNIVKRYFKPGMESKPYASGLVMKKDEAEGSCDVRSPSTSSAETISELLADSPAIRRNNRFRVSFVTDSSEEVSPSSENKTLIKGDRVLRSSLKRPQSSFVSINESAQRYSSNDKNSESVKMVSVGTQTNKSFRYSLRKRKGHVSDSDIDETFLTRLTSDLKTLGADESKSLHKDVVKRNTSRQISANMHVKHSSLSQDDNSEALDSVHTETSKYPFDPNIEVIRKTDDIRDADEDIDDDVFENDESDQCVRDSDRASCDRSLTKQCPNENNTQGSGYRENRVIFCLYCNDQLKDDDDASNNETKLNKNNTQIDKLRAKCEKCKLLQIDKNNIDYEKTPQETDALIIENKGTFTPVEVDLTDRIGRTPSLLSLESSGYAELSSSDSTSSAN